MKETSQFPLRMSDSLDSRFGTVVGSYVAALVAPVVTRFVVEYAGVSDWILVSGILGTVSIGSASVVAVVVTRSGSVVTWLNAGWSPWVLPVAGFIPMFVYYPGAVTGLAYWLTDIQADSARTVVDTAGFVLGIGAVWCGEMVVRMARNRVASSAIADVGTTIEWTAAWPRIERVKIRVGVVLGCLVLVGALALWGSLLTLVYMLPFVLTVVLIVDSGLSDRDYRLTQSGLEQRRETVAFTARQFFPWSQVEGYTVSERQIVLHRGSLRPDVRFSRQDIRSDEDRITQALDEHLERRAS